MEIFFHQKKKNLILVSAKKIAKEKGIDSSLLDEIINHTIEMTTSMLNLKRRSYGEFAMFMFDDPKGGQNDYKCKLRDKSHVRNLFTIKDGVVVQRSTSKPVTVHLFDMNKREWVDIKRFLPKK